MNESLIKYLAGLLDADGALSFNFDETGRAGNKNGRYTVALRLTLAAADTVDLHGFVPSLPDLVGMGTVFKERNLFWWRVQRRADLEMLLPRLIKHMVIKARHWQWLLEMWRSYRGGYGECSCDEAKRAELTTQSKLSRRNVGPIKPKNHPTWAWVAGYLDGDGTYHMRRRIHKAAVGDVTREQWTILVSAAAHANDAYVLEFLRDAFGGAICDHNANGSVKLWQRALGARNQSFALRFLPKVTKHARLKRHKIDAILNHTRQQRLSVPGLKGQATV